jgi:hypothetical protein
MGDMSQNGWESDSPSEHPEEQEEELEEEVKGLVSSS